MLIPFSYITAADNRNFYVLTTHNGLSSNCILQMSQLSDGRMVIVTDKAVDIYDGQRFVSASIDTTQCVSLPAYKGATHLYSDSHDHLWMKQRGRLYCLDLRTMQWQKAPDWTAADFFITANGNIWILHGNQLQNTSTQINLQLSPHSGNLQDLMSHADRIYAFFSTGQLSVYHTDGHLLYTSRPYSKQLSSEYSNTSLVVYGTDNCFYQVRTGRSGSVLMSFNILNRQWHQFLTIPTWMHTLTTTPTGMLYLTTDKGYLSINPATGEQYSYIEHKLPDGTTLTTGINTVWLDREGGIWFGTYNNGLLYTSPLSGIFDTHPIDIEVRPILTNIYLHGQPLQIGQQYNHHTILEVTPPYVEQLVFSHDQNSLAFQFSTMNYVRPRSTCYRYRFSGEDSQWHTLSADSASHLVDDEGHFYLPLVSLPPGQYTLEVMASTNPDHWDETTIRRITFTIRPPWWQTPYAYLLYVVLLLSLIASIFHIYRRHMQRKNHEEMLLLRIQNLVEQIGHYKHSEAMVILSEPAESEPLSSEPEPTPQEKEFMERATRLVEQHIDDPSYNVERLASDLCMERTGLYKRLTTLIQQSPVAFIRSIRLHRAAEMLKQGEMSITDIALYTGFGSTSYFSKCFQKEFGCKPSEYV